MPEIDCIFEDVNDCPLKDMQVTCEACGKGNLTGIIKRAVSDFTKLGPAFVDVFNTFNSLIHNDGKVVEVAIPADSIHVINRVINTLFSIEETTSEEQVVYKRLIFYFFDNLIQEFKQREYGVNKYIH